MRITTQAEYGLICALHLARRIDDGPVTGREIAATDSVRVQLRLESYNFTNTPHLANPDNSVGDGEDFMTITSVTNLAREGIDERQFRLGIRIVF